MLNDNLSGLAISYEPVATLVPYSSNARTHSKQQIRKIAESIKNFGFTTPVLIDRTNTIIAGHGRVATEASARPSICAARCRSTDHASAYRKRLFKKEKPGTARAHVAWERPVKNGTARLRYADA